MDIIRITASNGLRVSLNLMVYQCCLVKQCDFLLQWSQKPREVHVLAIRNYSPWPTLSTLWFFFGSWVWLSICWECCSSPAYWEAFPGPRRGALQGLPKVLATPLEHAQCWFASHCWYVCPFWLKVFTKPGISLEAEEAYGSYVVSKCMR